MCLHSVANFLLREYIRPDSASNGRLIEIWKVGSTLIHRAQELLIRVTRTCRISVISRPNSLKITIKFRYYLGLHYAYLFIYQNPHLDSHSRIQELFVENHYFRPYILCLSLRAPYGLPFRILFKFVTHIIIRMYGHSLSGQNLECRGYGISGWAHVMARGNLSRKNKMCFNHALPGHRSLGEFYHNRLILCLQIF